MESVGEGELQERVVDSLELVDKVSELIEELGIDVIGEENDLCE